IQPLFQQLALQCPVLHRARHSRLSERPGFLCAEAAVGMPPAGQLAIFPARQRRNQRVAPSVRQICAAGSVRSGDRRSREGDLMTDVSDHKQFGRWGTVAAWVLLLAFETLAQVALKAGGEGLSDLPFGAAWLTAAIGNPWVLLGALGYLGS